MDLLKIFVQRFFLPRKQRLSLKEMEYQKERRPLPVLRGGVQENGMPSIRLAKAVNQQCGKISYKYDAFNGLQDRYTHPEHLQWMIETGKYDKTFAGADCDETANYAICLFHKAGVDDKHLFELNMVVGILSQITQAKYNHVLCGFNLTDSTGVLWTGVIDTNSAGKDIFWSKGTVEEATPQILQHFKELYSAKYYALIQPLKKLQELL